MAVQTPLESDAESGARDNQPPGRQAMRGAARLLHDLVILAELQWDLAKADFDEGVRSYVRPRLLIAAGGALALMTIPALWVALGVSLMQWFGFSAAAAAWSTVFVGIAGTVLLINVGLTRRRDPRNTFARSKVEWRNNLEWFKRTLKRH